MMEGKITITMRVTNNDAFPTLADVLEPNEETTPLSAAVAKALDEVDFDSLHCVVYSATFELE